MAKITPELWYKNYDPHILSDFIYPKESLGKLYTRMMAKYPNNPACWTMNGEMLYEELLQNVEKFASFLQANGVQKGDVVSICLVNCPQYLIAHFGTLLIGAIASGLNPLLSEQEMVYQLKDSGSKVFVTLDAIYEKRLQRILNDLPNLEIIVTTNLAEYMELGIIKETLGKLLGKIPKGKVGAWPGKYVVKFQEVMKNTSINFKEVPIDVENDIALLQYTGGTTGFPKGTELTHANMIAQHTLFTHWGNIEEGKHIVMSAFPAFHLAGLMVLSETVWVGGSQVLIPNPRDTDHFIAEMIAKKPTLVANVPTLYGMIMNNPKSKDIPKDVLDNVIVYISGAAPFPVKLIQEFEEHMKAQNKVMELYGMTETSPVATCNPFFGKKKVGTVGLPLPNIFIKIADLESGEDLETGQPGEILIKGSIVARGYHKKPDATTASIKNGWLHTGDVGIMDEEGYIQIVDRIKDMLIVGGYKVYSVHVEDIMVKHPNVELAAIVGVPDQDRPGNDMVKAYIKLKTGIERSEEVLSDIKTYAKENLSKYENPKLWEFREEMPLTTVGKVLKKALRDSARR